MKRHHVTGDAIASVNAVATATRRAARGKRHRADVRRFLRDVDASIARVVSALRAGRLPQGQFRAFTVHDPKRRIIHAAPFADRVAHHAIVAPLQAPLDNWLEHTSFACRPGKGVHAAVQYAARQCRRFPVYLKLDVAGYFPAIDHTRLRSLLAERLKGDALFALIDAVLATHSSTPGLGLPIGALTSQHFANVYLNPGDRWLRAQPGVLAHCRYMDDTVVWCPGTRIAREVFQGYQAWILADLGLTVKPPIIQKCKHGLGLCGVQIHPDRLRPSARRKRRVVERLRHWQHQHAQGAIDTQTLQRNTDAVLSVLAPGDTLNWRRRMIANGLEGAWQ